jgi:hypothetical protein
MDYAPPVVTDYGDLVRMTASVDPLFGDTGTHDLSFSSPPSPGAGGAAGVVTGAGTGAETPPGPSAPAAAQEVLGVSDYSGDRGAGAGAPGAPGGGGAGGGAPGGGVVPGGGGGTLPFTGFLPGALAATGTALTAAGAALRRTLRRGSPG